MYAIAQIKHTETRKKFPFHMVYLADADHIQLVLDSLPCCIVVPPNAGATIRKNLEYVAVSKLSVRKFKREECFENSNLSCSLAHCIYANAVSADTTLADLFIVVPILQKRKNWNDLDGNLIESVGISYLQSDIANKEDKRRNRGRWFRRNYQSEKVESLIPAGAFLKIPTGQHIDPVCAACKNSLLNIMGKCQLGDEDCYEGLEIGGKVSILENITKYREALEK